MAPRAMNNTNIVESPGLPQAVVMLAQPEAVLVVAQPDRFVAAAAFDLLHAAEVLKHVDICAVRLCKREELQLPSPLARVSHFVKISRQWLLQERREIVLVLLDVFGRSRPHHFVASDIRSTTRRCSKRDV